MSEEITPELVEAARNQGFVNHCIQQGMDTDTAHTVLNNVYAPAAEVRANTLGTIVETIVPGNGN